MTDNELLQIIADNSDALVIACNGLVSALRACAILLALMWASVAWRDMRTVVRGGGIF